MVLGREVGVDRDSIWVELEVDRLVPCCQPFLSRDNFVRLPQHKCFLCSGRLADTLSRVTYNKYISQKKEKLQYVAVSTLRIIETSSKH